MFMSQKIFIPQKIYDTLIANGFRVVYSNFDENMDKRYFPDGKNGMIEFERYVGERFNGYYVNLYIHYSEDGKHDVNLCVGDNENDIEYFKVRNIIYVLKRRNMI